MKLLFIFFFGVVFTSCFNQAGRPDNLIAKEKMASILIKIHLTEASIDNKAMPKDSSLSFYLQMEGSIFEKYQVDSSSFRSSFKYYASNIKDLDEIYEWVLDSLNSEQAELTTSPPK